MFKFTLLALGLCLGLFQNTLASAARASTQITDVLSFIDLSDQGDAWLLRTRRGVTARLRVAGLDAGAYTVWWLIWNNPEACGADGCNDGDFGDPAIDVDIGYATGHVVSHHGTATFTANLTENEFLTGFPAEFGIASGSGLIASDQAEIHLIVRSHGPKVPGLTAEMTHTFNGGCVYDFPFELPLTYGTPGPNSCMDLLFAVFP